MVGVTNGIIEGSHRPGVIVSVVKFVQVVSPFEEGNHFYFVVKGAEGYPDFDFGRLPLNFTDTVNLLVKT